MLSLTQHSDLTKIVKVEMVKQVGHDLMVHYKTSFPWAMISPSIHQIVCPFMGAFHNMPAIKDYWSSRNRFQNLLRFWHFADNKTKEKGG